jgi:prepilin peptidase CpaA
MGVALSEVSDVLQLAGAALFGLAALQDIARRLVPNGVPLAIAAVGVALRVIDGTLPAAVGAALAVFLVAFLCWRRGWMGGADVKLFAAGALLVPPGAVLAFVLATSVAGGVLGIAYWLVGRLAARPTTVIRSATRPSSLLRRWARIERRRLRRGGPLPYAVAVSVGACCILLQG